jgi:NADH pyrophosphatase NudC (nudix superfamily)
MHLSEKIKPFNYCPSCGSSDIFFSDMKKVVCRRCSFTYYHNVAAAVAGILEYDKKVVLIRRAKEPGKGKLDMPGGFVDPKESLKEALRREIKEELRIAVGKSKYLGSCPNVYEYEGVLYNTCDIFFYSKINTLPTDFDRTEIEELILINPLDVPNDKIAFESIKTGLRIFRTIKSEVKHGAK